MVYHFILMLGVIFIRFLFHTFEYLIKVKLSAAVSWDFILHLVAFYADQFGILATVCAEGIECAYGSSGE
jgi:hypothetical protein